MYQDILKPVAEELAKYGCSLQPPCEEGNIHTLIKRVKEELSAALPDNYAAFLREVKGLDYNGLVIFADETTPIAGFDDRFIEGIVEANLGYRDAEDLKDYLVLGTNGGVHYVQKIGADEYQSIDAVSLDLYEKFDSFPEMLRGALRDNA
ncbi:MAG: YrhA family protein [Vulcanimicrobiota bacterium]